MKVLGELDNYKVEKGIANFGAPRRPTKYYSGDQIKAMIRNGTLKKYKQKKYY